jgi:hypothetical protein
LFAQFVRHFAFFFANYFFSAPSSQYSLSLFALPISSMVGASLKKKQSNVGWCFLMLCLRAERERERGTDIFDELFIAIDDDVCQQNYLLLKICSDGAVERGIRRLRKKIPTDLARIHFFCPQKQNLCLSILCCFLSVQLLFYD